MTETARTMTFVGAALASMVVAWFVTPSVDVTPKELANANEGKQFFPEFVDPNEPTSIRVVAFDEAQAVRKPFAVEFKNGLWTIPSHHDYPADGATKLAKTASSIIGIKREKFRSASEADHESLGVVDPLDEDSTKLKGRGKRLTLSRGDTPLADLIIGKQVRDQPGYYYVRVPSEKATYVAKVDLDLSTKFADWVETDLLKVNRDELTQIKVENYQIDSSRQQTPLEGEVVELDRPKSADPWKLAGLDAETEELETSKINDLVGTLDDLKLVGVRPKPKGINADLTVDRDVVQNQLQLQVLAQDLRSHGFEVGPDRANKELPRLYARGGELDAATSKGMIYTLRFGDIFSGDESEIEIGSDDAKKEGAGETEKNAADDASSKDDADNDADKPDATKQSSRYLFVSVRFDEKNLGDLPAVPTVPEGLPADAAAEVARKFEKKPAKKNDSKSSSRKKPAADDDEEPTEQPAKPKEEECGPDAVAADDDDAAAKGDEDEKPAAAQPAADAAEKKEADKKEADEKDAEQEEAEKEARIEALKKTYQTLWEKYDADMKAHEAKVKEGEEKVAELNLRFGDWYYVISADSYKKLHVSRKDLVKEKAKPADSGDKPPAGTTATPEATDDAAKDKREAPTGENKPDAAEANTKDEAQPNNDQNG